MILPTKFWCWLVKILSHFLLKLYNWLLCIQKSRISTKKRTPFLKSEHDKYLKSLITYPAKNNFFHFDGLWISRLQMITETITWYKVGFSCGFAMRFFRLNVSYHLTRHRKGNKNAIQWGQNFIFRPWNKKDFHFSEKQVKLDQVH